MDPNQQNQPQPNNVPPQPQPNNAPPAPQPNQPQPAAQPQQGSTVSPQQPVAQGTPPQPQQSAPQPQQQPIGQPAMPNQPAGPKKPLNKKLIGMIAGGVVLLIVLAIAAMSLFGGGGIVSKLSGVALEDYNNSNFNFSMKVPEGWSVDETDGEFTKSVVFKEPVAELSDESEQGKHEVSITVKYEKARHEYAESTESEYFDQVKRIIKRSIEDPIDYDSYKYIVELINEEQLTLNGYPALLVEMKVAQDYEDEDEEDETAQQYALFVYVDEKNQYEITLSAHKSEDAVLAKANDILKSFAPTSN